MSKNTENSTESPQKAGDAAERRTSGWDIRNAPRNYASLVAYQAGGALFSFGAVWIITRYLGSEGYGGIIAIIAASQVAQVLVNWTSVATVRFGVDEFIETEKIARTFWLRLSILTVNLILVLALSPLWFPILSGWLKLTPQSYWFVIGHFAVTVLWIHAQMSLQAAKLMRTQGLLQMVERFLILVGLSLLSFSAWLTPGWAMICYIAGPLVAILGALFVLRTYVISRFSIDWDFLRKFLAFSLPLLPFSLVGYFSGSYIDAVFLTRYLSTKDLGVYSVATQISGIVLQLPTLANTLLLPLFVSIRKEQGNQRLQNYFRNILPSLTLLWGVGCTALSFFSYFLIPRVFGQEFVNAVLPLWILMAASAVTIPISIGYASISNAASTTYISMYSALVAAITNVIGNFLLIPALGIAGSAWASLIAYSASTVTFAFLTLRSAEIRLSWTPLAIVPSLASLAVFAVSERPVISVIVCLSTAILVGYFSKTSITETWLFLRNRGAERIS